MVRFLFRSYAVVAWAAMATVVSSAESSAYPSTSTSAAASTTTSSTAESSTETSVHRISVGYGGRHIFSPMITKANVGDIIEFRFFPANHSVVRAEFKYPCIPYEDTGANKVGFFSGFHPTDAILTSNPETYNVTVDDENPIYFYCSQEGSCLQYGMIGAINPASESDVYEQQQIATEPDQIMLQPGEPFPEEAATLTSLSGMHPPTTTPTTSAGASVDKSGGSSGLSGGAIGGIVVGGIAFLAILLALFFYIGRSRTLKQRLDRDTATVTNTTPQTPHMSPQMHQATPSFYSPNPSDYRPQSNMTMPYDQPPQYPKSPNHFDAEMGHYHPAVSPNMRSQEFHGRASQYTELGTPNDVNRTFSPPPLSDIVDPPKEHIQAPVELPGSEKQ